MIVAIWMSVTGIQQGRSLFVMDRKMWCSQEIKFVIFLLFIYVFSIVLLLGYVLNSQFALKIVWVYADIVTKKFKWN